MIAITNSLQASRVSLVPESAEDSQNEMRRGPIFLPVRLHFPEVNKGHRSATTEIPRRKNQTRNLHIGSQ